MNISANFDQLAVFFKILIEEPNKYSIGSKPGPNPCLWVMGPNSLILIHSPDLKIPKKYI